MGTEILQILQHHRADINCALDAIKSSVKKKKQSKANGNDNLNSVKIETDEISELHTDTASDLVPAGYTDLQENILKHLIFPQTLLKKLRFFVF